MIIGDNMKALVTGGSSGIGLAIAKKLDSMGYDIILVSRNKKKLEAIKQELANNTTTIATDISSTYNCKKLFKKVKDEDIDILINCAGVGQFGYFNESKIDDDLDLIDLNIEATHTLTKLFLKYFNEKNNGYILNVASTASFSPGPLMATYFASKAYVYRLTMAINEELKHLKSNVYVGCFCPGPVNTHFNDKLGIKFSKALDSNEAAEIAIKGMFKRKTTIIPSFSQRLNARFSKLVPRKYLLKANYNVQIKKLKNKQG